MQTCNMVQAGYGEADITPDNPSEMVGFYRPDNRSRGVRDSLRLQALVWEADGVMGGLIVIDSLGLQWSCPMSCGTGRLLRFTREGSGLWYAFPILTVRPMQRRNRITLKWYAGRQIRLSGRPREK